MQKTMQFRLLCTFLLCFLCTPLLAQRSTQDSLGVPKFRSYLDFLQYPAENGQATLFTGQLQYLYSPWGKSLKTGGLHISVGLNLARFFSNQFILGVFADYKGAKGWGKQRFASDYLAAYNAAAHSTFANPSDSAHAAVVHAAFNGSEDTPFQGSYFGNVGIMFSPFPQRFGGFLLCVKTGYRYYPIFGTYDNSYLADGQRDHITLDVTRIRAVELTFKPYTFFRNGFWYSSEDDGSHLLMAINLGFYYERLDLRKAVFDKMPFDQMVSPAFFAKYGIDHRFGFKIGVGIY